MKKEEEKSSTPKLSYQWAGTSGYGTSFRSDLGDGLFGEVGSLFGLFKLLLGLAEFGQVQGGDLFL